MITKEKTAELLKTFGKSAQDSGSAEVQVAIMTERIANLTGHLKEHKLDNHSKRGLLKLIGRRRRLLNYISKKDFNSYKQLIEKLGLRK